MTVQQSLTVDSINISRGWNSEGPYTATVKVKGMYQELTLRLPEDVTERVIGVIQDLIVDGSREVADGLARTALNYKALEHQA